ncbi:polysaccharide biosynthesis C-terminal domain-containing protein [Mycobacterium sp. 852013-51886_SCH5428379]|uniref:lipopolysaccharide biosynthesis protein n=1 Tax=Mycobacterium sp. 852013-51886_SCH5428379 TaxID=1834111 RepID=UPI0009EEA72C
MTLISKIARYRAYLSFGASNLAVPLATVVTAPLLAQALGVDGRGELAAASAPLLLAISAATVGIPEAITYLSASGTFPERLLRRTGMIMLIIAGCLGVTAIYAFSTGSFVEPAARDAMMIIAPALCPTLAVGAFRAAAAAREDWLAISSERIANGLMQLCGIVALFAVDRLSILSAAIVIAYAPALSGVTYLFRRRRLPDADVAVRATTVFRGIVRYGPRVWAGSVFGILLTRLDQVLMVPLSDSRELGLYIVAVTVGEVPLVISRAVRDIMLTKDSRTPSFELLARASRLTFYMCGALVIVVLMTMPWTIPFLFGEEFRGVYPSLTVILIGILLGVPGSVAGSGLMARNRPGVRSWLLAAAAVVNIVLVVVLVPVYGALGAALASMVAYALGGLANVIALRILFGASVCAFFFPRLNRTRL